MFTPRKRVQLTCDLTSYRPGLVEGSLGWTGEPGTYGVMVMYDNGARLDTLWRSLEVQEKETKKEAARCAMVDFEAAIKTFIENGGKVASLTAAIKRLSK